MISRCDDTQVNQTRATIAIFAVALFAILVSVVLSARVRWLRSNSVKTQRALIVRRKLWLPQILIDTMCINALQRDPDVNQLETWDARGVISLRLPEQAQREVEAAGDKQRRKAMNRLVPQAYIETDEEKKVLRTIEDIISPTRPLSKNDAGDAINVFIAWKYARAILITLDGALLKKAKVLRSAVGAQVMKPGQVVELVRKQIAARDKAARSEAQRFGSPLPAWVGQD